jgi:hypothetical protein
MKDLSVVESQLDRVLGFFPRVDAKMAGIFAVNTAILTLCTINVTAPDLTKWYIDVPGLLVLVGLFSSYTFLYRCNFPNLQGGQGSLIYFVAIQNRTESKFRDEYEAITDDAYRADLLEQIWRNSAILCAKYHSLAYAVRITLATMLPLTIFLMMTAVEHSRVPLFKS